MTKLISPIMLFLALSILSSCGGKIKVYLPHGLEASAEEIHYFTNTSPQIIQCQNGQSINSSLDFFLIANEVGDTEKRAYKFFADGTRLSRYITIDSVTYKDGIWLLCQDGWFKPAFGNKLCD